VTDKEINMIFYSALYFLIHNSYFGIVYPIKRVKSILWLDVKIVIKDDRGVLNSAMAEVLPVKNLNIVLSRQKEF